MDILKETKMEIFISVAVVIVLGVFTLKLYSIYSEATASKDAITTSKNTTPVVGQDYALAVTRAVSYDRREKPKDKKILSKGDHKGLAITILKFEEGFRPKPYLDSKGYVTIGYGKLLCRFGNLSLYDGLEMSEEEAYTYLRYKVYDIDMDLGTYFPNYRDLETNLKAVLISMAYQMGVNGVSKFYDTKERIAYGLDPTVQMLDSKWAREDSPARARRHAELASGRMTFEEVYKDYL